MPSSLHMVNTNIPGTASKRVMVNRRATVVSSTASLELLVAPLKAIAA
jgi:hypothetical protein